MITKKRLVIGAVVAAVAAVTVAAAVGSRSKSSKGQRYTAWSSSLTDD